MKTIKILALWVLTVTSFAACSSDGVVDEDVARAALGAPEDMIHFTTRHNNVSRATEGYKTLESYGINNFGVWSFKYNGTPDNSAAHTVMDNYLVSYESSKWIYEGLGSSERAGSLSNNTNQYIKYWDHSTEATNFYAYAPYLKQDASGRAVSFSISGGTGTMTIPNVMFKACMSTATDVTPNDTLLMYGGTRIAKAAYNQDVRIQFKRCHAKIRLAFYETIPGYTVELINYDGTAGDKGVTAVPAKQEGTEGAYTYTHSDFYTDATTIVTFSNAAVPADPTFAYGAKAYDLNGSNVPTKDGDLNFTFGQNEDGTDITTLPIGDSQSEKVFLPLWYYAIPQNVDGFTFWVAYRLIAEDTGEVIYVRNASVHVPGINFQWAPNTEYTYVFKITKDTNGTSGTVTPPAGTYSPATPASTPALTPIVFDHVEVADWTPTENVDASTDGSDDEFTINE